MEVAIREEVKVSGAAMAGTGRSFPLGATLVDGGANFSVFSRTAECIELLLFDAGGRHSSFARDPHGSV